jgi:hypothetical protein
MGKIEDAKNLQELGDAVQALATSSFDSYQKAWLSWFESMTGAKPFSSEECGKNLQLMAGTAAKDMSTANLAWQKAMQIMTPPPPPPGQ